MESIKYNNIFSLFKLLTSIFILASIISLSTISVSADVDSDARSAFSANDGSSNGAVTSGARIKNSMDRANYGYLVYLVKNQSGTNTAEPIPGLKPVLFMCSRTIYEDASHWPDGASVQTEPLNWNYCKDRMGFYGPIDPTTRMYTVDKVWNVAPYSTSGAEKISNTPKITEWLASPAPGGTSSRAAKFIDDYWPGKGYGQEFEDDNIIIVIETVANFGLFKGQSAAVSAEEQAKAFMVDRYGTTSNIAAISHACRISLGLESELKYRHDTNVLKALKLIRIFKSTNADSYTYKELMSLTKKYDDAINSSSNSNMIIAMQSQMYNFYCQMYNAYLKAVTQSLSDNANGYVATHNYPFVATLARISDYMAETGAASPANTIPTKVLPWTQQLRFPQIGYPKNTVPLNGTVGQQVGWADMKNSGTSMLMYKASTLTITGVQTTCDENKIPTEHEAPNESTGNCIIIKTYREKINGVITADKGTYYRENVCPNIVIDDEGFGDHCYKVVAWRETNRLRRSGISAFNWEASVPGTVGQSGNSSGSVVLDNENGYKYLYVLLDSAL